MGPNDLDHIFPIPITSPSKTRLLGAEDAPHRHRQGVGRQHLQHFREERLLGSQPAPSPRSLLSTGAAVALQALCTFRKSLWRDLEDFVAHFDFLPSVLCCRE